MINMIEMGKQVGISKLLNKGENPVWYFCAIQKYENVYYVYESEIFEKNMPKEEYEYEEVCKYNNLDDLFNKFTGKYDIKIGDLNILKGEHIFNVKFYI